MTITATEFKAKCLNLMDRVAQTNEPILITKHGQIVAQLAPPPPTEKKPWLALRGSVKIKGDIIRPALSRRKLNSYLAREAKRIGGFPH